MVPICPLCGEALVQERPAWHCENGHFFDVGKQGYVNLLPVQSKHSLHPGDPLSQVHSRRRFLTAGHYAPIAQRICGLLQGHGTCLLDVGCGEGYYLRQIQKALPQTQCWGLDISKDAVRLAAGADKQGHYLVGTAAHLPFRAHSFQGLLSLFAPTLPEEYHRVLESGGVFLQALTHDDHLQGLKSTIYPTLIDHEKAVTPQLPGFRLIKSEELSFPITLRDNQTVQDLLSMTPHYWRITREAAQRVEAMTWLCDMVHIQLNLYESIILDSTQ